MEALLAQPNQRYFGPHRDYLYMRLLLKAGLRASEAVALRPEHIDLMSGRLVVREGKGARDRTLWIGEKVLGELQEWIDRLPKSSLAPDPEGNRSGDLSPAPVRQALRSEDLH